jgi:hypothetical protein
VTRQLTFVVDLQAPHSKVADTAYGNAVQVELGAKAAGTWSPARIAYPLSRMAATAAGTPDIAVLFRLPLEGEQAPKRQA